jgi:hypothetical protein
VLAVGWIVTLLNLDVITVTTLSADAVPKVTSLFDAEGHVLAFGFLGAYFFTVNTVLRSYVRGDLQPKAYSQITGRILVVAVLSSLIALTDWGSNQIALTVAFLAGIVPDTVLLWVIESLRKVRGMRKRSKAGQAEGSNRDPIAETQPLTELDGIDLYERARLAGEGVSNVEALAHGNLSDLLLQTRIPSGRLIDWVDQAVLYLHTALGNDGDHRRLFDALRSRGIRTATDLLTVSGTEGQRKQLVKAVGVDLMTIDQLELLRAAIADAEWVRHLLNWRANKRRPARPIDIRPDPPDPPEPPHYGGGNGHHPPGGGPSPGATASQPKEEPCPKPPPHPPVSISSPAPSRSPSKARTKTTTRRTTSEPASDLPQL